METVAATSPTEQVQPELAHKLIASDRVEGTPVCSARTWQKVGTIKRIMIDKLSGHVAYAVLTFGGFIGFGERHYPVPWAALHYDPHKEAYVTDITVDQLKNAPSYEEDASFDWGDRHEQVNKYYRQPQYWA